VEVQPNLPDIMVHLRLELEAIAVLLLNDNGHVLARAGDLPDTNEEVSLLSSLLSIYSAGQKVTRLIGKKAASSWYVFDGADYDLIFAPVGLSHAMLVIGKGWRMKTRFENRGYFLAARKQIEPALGEVPLAYLPPTKHHHPLEAVDVGMREMDPLFKDSRKRLKPADLNDFWIKPPISTRLPPNQICFHMSRPNNLAWLRKMNRKLACLPEAGIVPPHGL